MMPPRVSHTQDVSPSERTRESRTGLCSVCIATYRRPALLARLLESLRMQSLPEGTSMEVIVIDNDPEGSAGPIVERFRDAGAFSCRYFRQPVKNISITRNLAVEKADGEYLLFIDDDETACRDWLRAMLAALESSGADGVFGPILPDFPDGTPEWMRRRELLYRIPLQNTGEPARMKYTGNCLVRSSLLRKIDGPFDPRFGTTGGEDSFLFEILERQGACFLYCREAPVYEFLPPTRTTLSHLFLRGIKDGGNHTRRILELSHGKRWGLRPFLLGKAIAYGSLSLLLFLLLLPSPYWRTYWLVRLGSNGGRFLSSLGWNYQFYG